MDFIGLNREFSGTVVPLAADDRDLNDYFCIRMVPECVANMPTERVDFLSAISQLGMRDMLSEGYRLTRGRDTATAIASCIRNIIVEQGLPMKFNERIE